MEIWDPVKRNEAVLKKDKNREANGFAFFFLRDIKTSPGKTYEYLFKKNSVVHPVDFFFFFFLNTFELL